MEAQKVAFQYESSLKHLPRLEITPRAHQAEPRLPQFRGTIDNKRAPAKAHFHHTHRRQIAGGNPLDDDAGLRFLLKLPLWRDLDPRLQRALLT